MPRLRPLRLALAGGLVAASLAVGSLARADEHKKTSHIHGKGEQAFWDWVIDPHASELRVVLAKVTELRSSWVSADGSNYGYNLPNLEQRRQRVDDAIGMLRYAAKLAPGNLEVERELGFALDENDEPGAKEAIEAYLAGEIPDRIVADAHTRLGRMAARDGDWDQAISQFRLAMGEASFEDPRLKTQNVLCLAEVYMQTGRLEEAIDLLVHSVSSNPSYYGASGPDTLIDFALAVAYDRDEQITLAHDILDRIIALGGGGTPQLNLALSDGQANDTPFVVPLDRHYFAALQYEALGFLSEAKAEWRSYARGGDDAPFRARALSHARDVDRLREENAAKARAERKKPKPKETPVVVVPPPPVP